MMRLILLLLCGTISIHCLGQTAKNRSWSNLEKLDSVLNIHLGYNTGQYWNNLWANYYSYNNFKGLRSLKDPNIVRYNIYTKDYPLVLINEVPLLFYDISRVEFTKIKNVAVIDSASMGMKVAYPFLRYTTLSVEAELIEHNDPRKNKKGEYKEHYNMYSSPVGLTSILDSALLVTIGFNRNQHYNYSVFNMFKKTLLGSYVLPIVSTKYTEHPAILPQPIIINDTSFSIYCNGLPIEFFDDQNWKSQKINTGITKVIRKNIDPNGDKGQSKIIQIRVDILLE